MAFRTASWAVVVATLLTGCADPQPPMPDEGQPSTPSIDPTLHPTPNSAEWNTTKQGGTWAAAVRFAPATPTPCDVVWSFHSLNDPHGIDVAYGLVVEGEVVELVIEQSWAAGRVQAGDVDTAPDVQGLPGGIAGTPQFSGVLQGEVLLFVAVHEAESTEDHPESLGWSVVCDAPIEEVHAFHTSNVALYDDRSANGTASAYGDLVVRAAVEAQVSYSSPTDTLATIRIRDYEQGNLDLIGPDISESYDLSKDWAKAIQGKAGPYTIRWNGITADTDAAVDNSSGGVAGIFIALEPI